MKRLWVLLFLLCSQQAFSQGYSGLIGRWPFTGNANDVSGNGLNGIVRGATLTTGYTGLPNTAYLFNGTTDYITVPYNALMNSKVHSMCVLIKPLTFNSGLCQGNFVLCRGPENTTGFYGLEFFDNAYDNSCSIYSPGYEVFAGGTGASITSDPGSYWLYTPYTIPGNWYCVVLTYDGTSTLVYINGILKTTFHNTCTYAPSTDSLTICKSEDGPPFDYFVNAVVDEVRLYNRVLSPAEVTMFCDSAEAIYTVIPKTCDSIALPDTIRLCKNGTTIIPAKIAGTDTISSIHWWPATGLSDTSILNPTLTAGSSRWYDLTVSSLLPGSLVVNGDFSAGNTGFTSSYTYVSGPGSLVPTAVYAITTDPHLDNAGAASFGDHTSGSGNMLAINGAATPVDVWCETITVSPNTYYNFSAWFANWSSDTSSNLPIIQFEINGILIGSVFNFPHADGQWKRYATTWYSGPTTSATVCINDRQTAALDNDFAIDDISFQQVCVARDSVYVAVSLNDTIHTSSNLSACISSAPLTLNGPATYTSYSWNTGSTSQHISVGAAGKYYVAASGGGCGLYTDTFHVSFNPLPVVSLGNDTSICAGTQITLLSPQPDSVQYAWSNGSAAPSISVSAGDFSLKVTAGGCSASASIQVREINAPQLNLGPDTTLCTGATLPLLANADEATYVWSDGGHEQSLEISETGTYWVTVTNKCGTASDTLNITYDFCDIWFPSAFTPNNDGKNDIIRVVGSLGRYTNFSLAIFNRWGQRVFFTEDIYQGWDGTFKGEKQDLGTYFYLINYNLKGKKGMMKGDFELIR